MSALPPSLSATLRALLDGFRHAEGQITMQARSVGGVGVRALHFDPDPTDASSALPAALLTPLEDGWGVEFAPATQALDGSPVALAYAFATWRIRQEFGAETAWRPRPFFPAVEAAAAALRGFPCPPTFVFDGATTIAALWSLTTPIRLPGEAPTARALLGRLATVLGADHGAAEEPRTWLPLPGSVVRGVGLTEPIPRVDPVVTAPSRRYAIDELMTAGVARRAPRQKGVPA
jgi:hypothetical protein